jgi:hypothetical protein
MEEWVAMSQWMPTNKVGRCMLLASNSALKAPTMSVFEPRISWIAFKIAFNFNLRRYNKFWLAAWHGLFAQLAKHDTAGVIPWAHHAQNMASVSLSFMEVPVGGSEARAYTRPHLSSTWAGHGHWSHS